MKKTLLSILLSAALALGGVPAAAFAAMNAQVAGSEENSQTRASAKPTSPEDITELLDAGPYVGGEAIATVSSDVIFIPETPTGELAEVICAHLFDTEGETFERSTGTYLPETALEGAREGDEVVSSEDVQVSTYLLSSNSLTTRELLEYLAEDPRVLDCSPNYLYTMDPADDEGAGDDVNGEADAGDEGIGDVTDDTAPEDADDAAADDVSANDPGVATAAGQEDLASSPASLANSASNAGDAAPSDAATLAAAPTTSFAPNAPADVTATLDASPLQWAFNRSTPCYKGTLDPLSIVGAPAWNTGATDSSGIVAVVDTGVDITHPDLAGAIADVSPYMRAAGGTAHGFNAFSPTSEPLDDYGHGTHVAGIIAAPGNGFGVTGAANGAKILPVKVGDSSGQFPTSQIAEGYAYLQRLVKAGADLRVVNNSWSGPYKDPALDLAVSELGSLGVVSVFASGNNGLDIDGKNFTAASLEYNQYAIVVDSIDENGKLSRFSNRGKKTTDVCAPGSGILSTTMTGVAGVYLPAVMRASSSSYLGFSSQSDVDALQAHTAAGASIGSLDEAVSLDGEGGSLAISGKQLVSARPDDQFDTASKRIILNIPVDESRLSEASMLGCSARFQGKTTTKAWLEVMGENGNWLKDGKEQVLTSGSWGAVSLNLSSLCSSSSKKIAVFHDAQGRAYIQASLCLSAKNLAAASSSLYLDAVGVGSTSFHYGFMSGTSMAAPAVSGLAAVLTTSIPSYTTLDAAIRAAKASNILISSARKTSALANACASGGIVDPTAFPAAIANGHTPYIGNISATAEAGTGAVLVTLTGSGFGAQASDVSLTDSADDDMWYEIVSWSDGQIVLRLASSQGSSQLEASVTNSAGESSEAAPASIYAGASEPSDPSDPSDPSKPGDHGGSSEGGDPSAPDGDDSGSGSARAAAGTAHGNVPATGDASVPTAAIVICAFLGTGVIVCAVVLLRKRR